MLDSTANKVAEVIAGSLDDGGPVSKTISAQELRSFVERVERLNADIKDLQDIRKEVFAEAKGRGYMVTILRKIINLRKRDANDLAEEEAVLKTYKSALGM